MTDKAGILEGAEPVAGVLDPFFGQPLVARRLAGGTFACGVHNAFGSYLAAQLFPSMEALIRVMRQRHPGWDLAGVPATEPVMVCPFTGGPILCVSVAGGAFRMQSPLWISGNFWSREEADWFVSVRNGVEPAFPRERVVIVGDREPDKVAEAQAEAEARHKVGVEHGHQAADRFLRARESRFGRKARGR